MRISKLYFISMLSVTAFAAILGGQILIPQALTFNSKSKAIATVDAYSAVLRANQQVVALRAPSWKSAPA